MRSTKDGKNEGGESWVSKFCILAERKIVIEQLIRERQLSGSEQHLLSFLKSSLETTCEPPTIQERIVRPAGGTLTVLTIQNVIFLER